MEHFFFFRLLYLLPEGNRLEAAVQGVMSRQQFSLLRLRRRSPAMSCGVCRGASSDYFWAVFLPLGDLPHNAVMQYACQDALYGGVVKRPQAAFPPGGAGSGVSAGPFFFLRPLLMHSRTSRGLQLCASLGTPRRLP